MPWAILDTHVYLGYWKRGLYAERLRAGQRALVVRHSAVVLSELRRGGRTREAGPIVEDLFRIARLRWEPTPADWWEAGRLIRKIGDARGWDTNTRREFQNDALIALTARRHGATVVTADRQDFDLLAKELRIAVLSV